MCRAQLNLKVAQSAGRRLHPRSFCRAVHHTVNHNWGPTARWRQDIEAQWRICSCSKPNKEMSIFSLLFFFSVLQALNVSVVCKDKKSQEQELGERGLLFRLHLDFKWIWFKSDSDFLTVKTIFSSCPNKMWLCSVCATSLSHLKGCSGSDVRAKAPLSAVTKSCTSDSFPWSLAWNQLSAHTDVSQNAIWNYVPMVRLIHIAKIRLHVIRECWDHQRAICFQSRWAKNLIWAV